MLRTTCQCYKHPHAPCIDASTSDVSAAKRVAQVFVCCSRGVAMQNAAMHTAAASDAAAQAAAACAVAACMHIGRICVGGCCSIGRCSKNSYGL
jgi:hypothetical protein